MGIDRTGRVSVSVSVKRVVSVAGNVDAFGGMAGVIVDGLREGPAGGRIGKVADGPEDTAWAGVLAVGCP